ncbi:MAG TPA: fructose-6-phosphate aldolase [Oceanithermus profundus]|uniref:Probable transaldolase n=1 Tax=Oceanithermus profundus TaxID=187137 RepID=A0A7C4ZJ44_9DEIN|nr:fructose-6-phosphate aldolase [Oceanithermus profundus]
MKLYLDTANVQEIREIHALGVLDGVTTNPSLVARALRQAGERFESENAFYERFTEIVREIASIVQAPVSAEALASEADAMVEEGRKLAALSEHVVVKLPISEAGLRACRALADEGVAVNMTLVFSANQALLAARAGARYVSPFLGRVDDIGWDGVELVRTIREIFDVHDLDTEIIAASVRHPQHVTASALAGADIATVPYGVLKSMIQHPLTKIGMERFLADWEKAKQEL